MFELLGSRFNKASKTIGKDILVIVLLLLLHAQAKRTDTA